MKRGGNLSYMWYVRHERGPQECRQRRKICYETKGRTRHRASDLLHITNVIHIFSNNDYTSWHAIHLLSTLGLINCLVFLHRMMRRPDIGHNYICRCISEVLKMNCPLHIIPLISSWQQVVVPSNNSWDSPVRMYGVCLIQWTFVEALTPLALMHLTMYKRLEICKATYVRTYKYRPSFPADPSWWSNLESVLHTYITRAPLVVGVTWHGMKVTWARWFY